MDEQVIEKIVRRVLKEILAELPAAAVKSEDIHSKCETPDFAEYKTPVLTERHLLHLHELTGSIVIPEKTVITPKARDVLQEKGIKLILNNEHTGKVKN